MSTSLSSMVGPLAFRGTTNKWQHHFNHHGERIKSIVNCNLQDRLKPFIVSFQPLLVFALFSFEHITRKWSVQMNIFPIYLSVVFLRMTVERGCWIRTHDLAFKPLLSWTSYYLCFLKNPTSDFTTN